MKLFLCFFLVALLAACGSTPPATKPLMPDKAATNSNAAAKPPVAQPADGNGMALLEAAGQGDNGKIEELLGKGANVNFQNPDSGSTPLIEAVYHKRAATVKLLLDKGADPNMRKKDGATALVFARENPEITVLLKGKGASAGANPELDTALLEACGKGDAAKVRELLDKGVDADATDESGRTSLTEATFNGHAEVVKLLLAKGADPNRKKKDGTTALTFADKHPDIAVLLRQAGAK